MYRHVKFVCTRPKACKWVCSSGVHRLSFIRST
jgi:hypothetical protein